jgi:hypothetical protein
MSTCNCCNDCCPEVVPVTVNNNDYTLDDAGLALSIADVSPADPNKKEITIQVDTAGYWQVHLWFVDTPTPSHAISPVVPTNPGWQESTIVTESDGSYTFEVEYATLKTWYLCASLGAGVEISSAITIGS